MRQGEAVFVDSGAWIALALSKDPLHGQARVQWDLLRGAGAKLHASIYEVPGSVKALLYTRAPAKDRSRAD